MKNECALNNKHSIIRSTQIANRDFFIRNSLRIIKFWIIKRHTKKKSIISTQPQKLIARLIDAATRNSVVLRVYIFFLSFFRYEIGLRHRSRAEPWIQMRKHTVSPSRERCHGGLLKHPGHARRGQSNEPASVIRGGGLLFAGWAAMMTFRYRPSSVGLGGCCAVCFRPLHKIRIDFFLLVLFLFHSSWSNYVFFLNFDPFLYLLLIWSIAHIQSLCIQQEYNFERGRNIIKMIFDICQFRCIRFGAILFI